MYQGFSVADQQAGATADLFCDPGAPLFSKCARCHVLSTDGPQRSGPHLSGLFGRQVGTVDGYRYSPALTDSDIVWTEDTVFDLFHRGPDKVLPGTKMPLQKLPEQDDRDALIAYLKAHAMPPGAEGGN